MKNNLISVIMSAYNSEETLEESIISILSQKHSNLELLIVDDASSDKTFYIMSQLKKTDDRIKIYKNEKNLGLTKSLNFLISKSNGNILARQDSDDISLPDRLFKQFNVIKNKNIGVCTSRAYIKKTKKKLPGFSFYLPSDMLIKYKNPFVHGTLMIEKSLMISYGCYNENYLYAQDYELFYKLIKNGEKIFTIREPLYILNMENNISIKFKDEQMRYAKLVRSHYKN